MMFKKILNTFIAVCFTSTLVALPQAHAATALNLPLPGTMVSLSPAYEPVMIKGLTVHKDNPFLFDFIVDVGQDKASGEQLKEEGQKLIKYFLASLAIPEEDLWVNLSPYEKDRTIPEELSKTDMGRDLLAQDYILKQITASLIYPEKALGKSFWEKVYTKAQQLYGTTEVPVNTFNKVWIMADKAEVFERNQTAFVTDSHLKVMLEEDYLALEKHTDVIPAKAGIQNQANSLGSQIVREIILPELEREVNTGKNFANLRQIFNSLILASWYKKNLKEALLNQVYSDKSNIKGIDLQDKTVKKQIYNQYLQAYKKGVFNYIKEDIDKAKGTTIPRKYFSGGVQIDHSMAATPMITHDAAQLARSLPDRALVSMAVGLNANRAMAVPPVSAIPDRAMAIIPDEDVLRVVNALIQGLDELTSEPTVIPLKVFDPRDYGLRDMDEDHLRVILKHYEEILKNYMKRDLSNFFPSDGLRLSVVQVSIDTRLIGAVRGQLIMESSTLTQRMADQAMMSPQQPRSQSEALNMAIRLLGHIAGTDYQNAQKILFQRVHELKFGMFGEAVVVKDPRYILPLFELTRIDPPKAEIMEGLAGLISDGIFDINAVRDIVTMEDIRRYQRINAMQIETTRAESSPAGDLLYALKTYVGVVTDDSVSGAQNPHRAMIGMAPKRVVLLGSPGAGKGTLALRMKEMMGVPHISTGDMLREERRKDSPLGREIKDIMDKGGLVSDEVMTRLVREKVLHDPALANGFILDGYPRTSRQARDLDQILTEAGIHLDFVLYVNTSPEAVVERLKLRSVEEGRPDDQEGVVRERMKAYQASTRPLIDYYTSRHALKEVDGNGTREEVVGGWQAIFDQYSLLAAPDRAMVSEDKKIDWARDLIQSGKDPFMSFSRIEHMADVIFKNGAPDRGSPFAATMQNLGYPKTKLEFLEAFADLVQTDTTITEARQLFRRWNASMPPEYKLSEDQMIQWAKDVISKEKEGASLSGHVSDMADMLFNGSPWPSGKKFTEEMKKLGSPKTKLQFLEKFADLAAKNVIEARQSFRVLDRSTPSQDRAMAAKGGIDLNTGGMNWSVRKDGTGVEMKVDPAMIERIKREGIDSLTPVIFRVTPVVSIWPLVGLEPPKRQEERLAGV